MNLFKKINKTIIYISAIWSFLSLGWGIAFIKKYYEVGLQSSYNYSIGKAGQVLAAAAAYLIAVVIIFALVSFGYKAIKENGKEREIFLYSLPIFIILLAYLLTDVSWASGIRSYYLGDEKNIWDSAVRLYPFIFVYSGELFLSCFFILPFTLSPSILKILFCAFVSGYVIYRTKKYYKSKKVFLLYLIFTLKPFLEYGIRVHRMHWYGMLYLLVAVKLYYDFREQANTNFKDIIIVEVLLSILTIWRREGIYLLIWGGLLVILVYGKISFHKLKLQAEKKHLARILVLWIAFEMLACLPETIYEMKRTDSLADGNVVYRAYLVHMMAEESFNRESCAKELATINTWIDLNQVDRYNTECAAEAYNDCYWEFSSFREGEYNIIRGRWSNEDVKALNAEVIKIIKKQPFVFFEIQNQRFQCSGTFKEQL